MRPRIGDILYGDFWPEPVRVLIVQDVGVRTKIEAVGVDTRQFYSNIFAPADLSGIQISSEAGRDFGGNGEAFFLTMEASRIRYAQQFDPLFAVNVSQVDPLPHQIEAVYHFMLPNPRIRFLLADDPGAGKTIMTGLLLKELKYRGVVRRCLVIVPGHLKEQWLREMKEKFGETFTVVDRAVVNANWGRNVWQDIPQVIASMDFAKQDDVMASLGEAHWDLAVVDEAHKMAAYRYGDKLDRTERYKFGELLSRTSDFLLFLTATPHRGDPENFRLFLDLLEPGMFANTELLIESVRNQDNPLFLRRLKEDLKDFESRPLFPPRHVATKTYRLSDDEKRLYNAVTSYVEKSYNKALSAEKRNVAFALLILQRRMASSVRAVRRSLERRKARLESLLSLGRWLAERDSVVDEEALEDAPEADRVRQEEDLVERLTAAETREELQAEIDTLADLIQLAREAERQEVETKLVELRKVITDERIQSTGVKLLIFTESRETLEYLADKLRTWGFSVVELHGGMNLDARIRAEHDFRERAQVMVSTEAGGEGINLQFCALMVNYDIPWTPTRLEQRMGRIHRYGQKNEVHIYNLVAADTREGKVLDALFRKLERIQQALGTDRVFDVIGEVLVGRSLKDLIVEAIANRRTMDEILGDIEAISDDAAIERTKKAAMEALATRHIDLQRVLGEDRAARENRLVPEYIERFFQRSCAFIGVNVERRDGVWRVPNVPYEVRNVPESFKHRFGEVFREYSRIAFEKEEARQRNAVFVAPGHPLLEAVIEQILVKGEEDVRRGALFADPDGQMDGWIWFIEGEIRDGRNQVAGRRLFAVFQPMVGDKRLINSSILWDLKPADGATADEQCPEEEDVIDFAVENVLEIYRQEIAEQRNRDAEIKRKYGLRSLEQMLLDSSAKLLDYETRRAKGEILPDVEIQNEQRRREELEKRKRDLQDEIRRETSLLPSSPRVLGVVRVVPKPPADSTLRSDAKIEAAGMKIAMEYERSQGRMPEDVSRQNLGYDIRSRESHGRVRYIEVKSRATTGPIILTPNEWLMAQRLGDEYWLYVVENASSDPILHKVQNPAARLEPDQVSEIVRYVIKDWKQGLADA